MAQCYVAAAASLKTLVGWLNDRWSVGRSVGRNDVRDTVAPGSRCWRANPPRAVPGGAVPGREGHTAIYTTPVLLKLSIEI